MSLRVLLADESPSIKKAFELALKDFGVKIKTVYNGHDVEEVFGSFRPDICFLDVLLPKLNGYEASKKIKNMDAQGASPVVLMWSSFMSIDEDKYSNSQADEKIEKPFDSKALREMVQKHVPRLNSNEISRYLIPEEAQPEEAKGLLNKTAPQEHNADFDATVIEVSEDLRSLDQDPTGEDLTSLNDNVMTYTNESHAKSPSLHSNEEEEAPAMDSFLREFDEKSQAYISQTDQISADLDDFSMEDNFSDTDLMDHDSPHGLIEKTEDLSEVEAFQMEDLTDPLRTSDPSIHNDLSQVATNESENNLPFTPPPFDSLRKQIEDEETQKAESTPEKSSPKTAVMDQDQYVRTSAPSSNTQAAENTETETISSGAANTKTFNLESELSKEELKRLIMAQSKDIIESVVWDVVPELARELIKKEIKRLTGEVQFDGDAR